MNLKQRLMKVLGFVVQPKQAIALCITLILIFLSIYFHFIRSISDYQFQARLISALQAKNEFNFKDIVSQESKKICFLPPYLSANQLNISVKAKDNLTRHINFFNEDDGNWWIILLSAGDDVVNAYSLTGKVRLNIKKSVCLNAQTAIGRRTQLNQYGVSYFNILEKEELWH